MKKVWLFVVLAFLLLIGAWATIITLAVKNQPEKIEHQAPDEAQP